jgi:hypothetical protein
VKSKHIIVLLLAISAATGSVAEPSRRAECDVEIPAVVGEGYESIRFLVKNGTQPLRGADVKLYKAGRRVRTLRADKRGVFFLSNIAPGRYTLAVRGWGNVKLTVRPSLEVQFPVDAFILTWARPHACPSLVAGEQ